MGEYDELLGKLNSLKGEVRKKALRKSLRAMGTVMQEAIIELAPVQSETPHGDLKPGELKGDIKVSVHVAADENAAVDSDYVTIAPGKKTNYIARFVETGHAVRQVNGKPRKRNRKGRADAHPFVRPAFDATRDKAVETFTEAMASEIKKVMDA